MKTNPAIKDLQQFKLALFILPIIPSIIFYFKNHYRIAICLLIFFWSIFLLDLLLGLIGKNAEISLYNICKKILDILGTIIADIALVFIWFCAILPTGLFAKLLKRDRLNLVKANKKSYWKEVQETEQTYENQY